MVLFLSGPEVDRVVSSFTTNDLVDLMAQVFFQLSASNSDPAKEESEICLPHRLGVPTTNHTALFMPSRITTFGTAMEVVSVPKSSAPDEVKTRGLPASTFVLDYLTGEVRAVVNASKLTALRNAAGELHSISHDHDGLIT